jgi:hypothetical protein
MSTADSTYLADANYYRLAYAVSAQRMNEALRAKNRTPKTKELLKCAYRDATRLRRDALHEIEQLQVRADRRKLEWWVRPLQPVDKRLLTFLTRTVEPCATLVLAGIDLYERRVKHAEELAAPIRKRADADSREEWPSYRTLYTLACYECSHAETVPRNSTGAAQRALRYLEHALVSAHGARRRGELLRWAGKDPSLRLLQTHPYRARFVAILKRFAPPEPAPPAKGRRRSGH